MRTNLLQRVYTSTAKQALSDSQIHDLLVECRINNLLNQVTGLLIYGDQRFFQVFEGPQDSVEALWQKLLSDPRHFNVRPLLCRETPRLLFKDWSMAFEKSDSPIASQIGGLSDLMADYGNQTLTSEKEVILLTEAFSISLQNEYAKCC